MQELLINIKMIRKQIQVIHDSELSKEVKAKRLGQLHFYLDFVETRYDALAYQNSQEAS